MQSLAPIVPDGASIRWHRLELSLRCERNTFAKAQPLRILDGILMTVAPPELKPPHKPRLFFHVPVGSPGNRIELGQDYPVRIVFPSADASLPAKFLENLGAPIPNFRLLSCTPPRLMSLADLQRENPEPLGTDEVRLGFYTLLDLKLRHPEQPWRIDAVDFGWRVEERLAKAFGLPLPPAEAVWSDFRLLPYFWERSQLTAPSSQDEGSRILIGNIGPLYLRGPVARVWPLLLLGREIGLGSRFPGTGAFSLDGNPAILTDKMRAAATYREALEDMFARHDQPEEFHHALRDPETAASELSTQVGTGAWQPSPARGFRVRKEGGEGERLIVQLAPRDYVVHKTLLQLLAPHFDRMFEPVSVGYRPGVSPSVVRDRIRTACRDGRIWAVRTDVENFFDQMDWGVLMEKLAALLPRADALVLSLLDACIHTPVTLTGVPMPRDRGVLQGSPLSPLLSNVYLDGFDEEMEKRGLCLVRFADDLLVLCRTETEAQAALSTIAALLEPLKLRLNETKTAVLPCEAGFQFLGQTYGGALDPATVAEARSKRALYIQSPGAWAGVDHDALTVRAAGELTARVPLRRLDGVVLLGAGGLSARLVERLDDWEIPLTVCNPSGRLVNTVFPRTREHHEIAAVHAARHQALGQGGRVEVARRFVQAKLHNFLAWISEEQKPGAGDTARCLKAALDALPRLASVEALRGAEGHAAAATFRYINGRAGPEWHTDNRVAGQRHDPWNSLLDFASHLLFGRMLVFVLQRGLNPWLGCLHSHQDRYESLVYDLMEPFRARLDRFVLNVTRLKIIQPEDFEPHPYGGTRLRPPAVGRFLEHWERELLSTYSGDPGHLLELIEAQVISLRAWVRGMDELRLYQAKLRQERRPNRAAVAETSRKAEPCTVVKPNPAVPAAASGEDPTQPDWAI